LGAGNQINISMSGNTTSDGISDISVSRSGTVNYGVGNAANIQFNNTTTVSQAILQSADGGFQFWSNPLNAGWAERMRIDASGNVGIGVTPSSWQVTGGRKAIEVGSTGCGIYGFSQSNMLITSGNYYNGTNFIATTTGNVSYAQQIGGEHRFYTGSGTAGNAITFTQAMTLDVSGNLGIGTASPTARLHSYSAAGGSIIRMQTGNNANGAFADFRNDAATRMGLIGFVDATNLYVHNDGAGAILFDTNNTERMRITSAGNVLIGTTSTVGSANAVATNGFNSKTVTVGANATVTTSVPDGCICIISQAGFSSDGAIFAIKSTGGSQATAVIAQNSTGYGFGTTTDPNTGTCTDLWISATNTLSIKDKTSTSRNFMLTFISAGL